MAPAGLNTPQLLSGVSQETNDAWVFFIRLFARDCVREGLWKARDLLPARLQVVNEHLSAASDSLSNTPAFLRISSPQPSQYYDNPVHHQPISGTNHLVSKAEPFIKEEISRETLPLLNSRMRSEDEGHDHTVLQWQGDKRLSKFNSQISSKYETARASRQELSPSGSDMKRRLEMSPDGGQSSDTGISKHIRLDVNLSQKATKTQVVQDKLLGGKGNRITSARDSSSTNISKAKPISNKTLTKKKALEHWRQFEKEEMAKVSNLETGQNNDSLQELPSISFEQLLGMPDLTSKANTEHKMSVEIAHAVVSFATFVASPEALSQFKQALIGWRSQTATMELMQATQFVSVLKALHHLEAQSAFNAIATRIKLVQLAEAVDVGNISLPTPQGRGNPIVKWLSAQYSQFLHLEYPNLEEGSRPWNTKLDDLKRKVKAGRRWQQLISRFGVGIIGLVPVFAPGDEHNADFNKLIKNCSELCFKLILDTLDTRKGNHIRLMSTKLEEFMSSLFTGNMNLPRLVLENMDMSKLEAQPNGSPELIIYLDVAGRDINTSSARQGAASSNFQRPGAHIDLTRTDQYEVPRNMELSHPILERLGLSNANLDEFNPTKKMSGAVVNIFMKMLQRDADSLKDKSLFLDSDFFSGINKCLNCRIHETRCDILEQPQGRCTQCQRNDVICENQRPSSKVDNINIDEYDRIFIPAFTKEITHWSLVVIKPTTRSIIHYDSLDYSGPERPDILTYALREVVTWVKQLISPSKWASEQWIAEAISVPKQPPGGNDCGICTIMFSRLLLSGQPFPPSDSLTPPLMTAMRASFRAEMLEGKFNGEISYLDSHGVTQD